MKSKGKQIRKTQKELNKKVDSMKEYSLQDAVKMVKELKFVKFDESIDLAINLGVDPRHADQNIRLTTSLPHGTGKDVKVLVVTQGPKEKEAKEAGADYVGKEFLEKLKSGWDDVDKVVATPDMMPELGKLGKVLGPKGLMPNPKSGTVTTDVSSAVKDLKAGNPILSRSLNVMSGEGNIAKKLKEFAENNQSLSIGSYPFQLNGSYGTNVVIRGKEENILDEALISLSKLFKVSSDDS